MSAVEIITDRDVGPMLSSSQSWAFAGAGVILIATVAISSAWLESGRSLSGRPLPLTLATALAAAWSVVAVLVLLPATADVVPWPVLGALAPCIGLATGWQPHQHRAVGSVGATLVIPALAIAAAAGLYSQTYGVVEVCLYAAVLIVPCSLGALFFYGLARGTARAAGRLRRPPSPPS